MSGTLEQAREFLAQRRIAVVGMSRHPKDFSPMVARELASRGVEVVPVHPGVAELDGRRCYPRVQDVTPPPDAVLVLVPAAQAEGVARDCVAAGVRRIWFHRGAGPGAASPAALAACAAAGIEPVTDLCPFMALQGAGFPHRVHRFFRTRLGHHRAHAHA